MRRHIIIFFVISLVGLAVGYFLTNSIQFGFCEQNQYSCRDLFNNIGDPLFYGMGALSLVFAALLAAPHAYGVWKKFAVWFVPLAALLFMFYPEPGSGDYFSPYPEQVFQWVSALYVLVSLALIIRSSLPTTQKKK